MMLRRCGPHRTLRQMRVLRQIDHDAPATNPRRDAIDQRGEFVIIVRIGIEVALLLDDDLGAARAEAHEIEAETGIERIGQCIEPLAKQPVDHGRLRDRLAGLDAETAHRAVGAEE